jgi:4-amino-4-deoxychorismate lyase
MIIALNGTFIDEKEAVVSVYDHGFLYGIGLFETFRTYGGRPFLLERHLERLADGCRELAIRFAADKAELSRWIAGLLEANGLADAYFRLTVTAGTDALGLPAADYGTPTVLLYVKPLPPYNDAVYRDGKELRLLRTRRNTPEGSVRLKSLHYMNNILAKRELQTYPDSAGAEGLMLTERGAAAEGIVSNVFFVSGGRLRTPSLDTGILPGVTRAFVLELANVHGISAEEGLYRWEDVTAADEVFITNSIQELVPITTLTDEEGRRKPVGSGKPGKLTLQLADLYTKEAMKDHER